MFGKSANNSYNNLMFQNSAKQMPEVKKAYRGNGQKYSSRSCEYSKMRLIKKKVPKKNLNKCKRAYETIQKSEGLN